MAKSFSKALGSQAAPDMFSRVGAVQGARAAHILDDLNGDGPAQSAPTEARRVRRRIRRARAVYLLMVCVGVLLTAALLRTEGKEEGEAGWSMGEKRLRDEMRIRKDGKEVDVRDVARVDAIGPARVVSSPLLSSGHEMVSAGTSVVPPSASLPTPPVRDSGVPTKTIDPSAASHEPSSGARKRSQVHANSGRVLTVVSTEPATEQTHGDVEIITAIVRASSR